MIPLRKKALEQASGMDYLAIKFGFTNLPDYASPTINEFLEQREELEIGKTVLFPYLTFSPRHEPDAVLPMGMGLALPATLKDSMSEMDVYLWPGVRTLDMAEALDNGDNLYHVVVQNGMNWPETLTEEGSQDSNLYVIDFKMKGFPRGQKSASKVLSKLVSELFPTVPQLVPVPVHAR